MACLEDIRRQSKASINVGNGSFLLLRVKLMMAGSGEEVRCMDTLIELGKMEPRVNPNYFPTWIGGNL